MNSNGREFQKDPRLHALQSEVKNYLQFLKDAGATYLPLQTPGGDSELSVPPEKLTYPPLSEQDSLPAERLEGLRAELSGCQRCRLHEKREHLVFGEGNPDADLLFIGEAPGFEEDHTGEPFVGKAGQLLTKIIEAIGIKREEAYICNVIKCRPPDNRNPLPEEIEACEPFLFEQIEAVSPKIICALGKFAAQTLLKNDAPISTVRGKLHDFQGRPLMPTYHPAFLLRNPASKQQVWDDMRLIKRLIDR